MSINAILFDLDGTLLPMDQEIFVKDYFGRLAKKLAPYGYEPNKLIETVWAGTKAMIKNDGSCTNEDAFWKFFVDAYGENVLKDKDIFEEFYRNEFQEVQKSCGFNPKVAKVIQTLKDKGLKLALATNPIFPSIATQSRMRWAGLKEEDFEFYTTYENSSSCKPNPKYYVEVMDKLGIKADECIMVGNDVTEDMVARELGVSVFLLTDCMINKDNMDISIYPHGNLDDMLEYILKNV